MSQIRYTTVIEERIANRWHFFSEQSIKEGEAGMTDREYLEACRALCHTTNPLRIKPSLYQARSSSIAYETTFDRESGLFDTKAVKS